MDWAPLCLLAMLKLGSSLLEISTNAVILIFNPMLYLQGERRCVYSIISLGWLKITLFQKNKPPYLNKGTNNKKLLFKNLVVPPDHHIFTITRNGVNFWCVAELFKTVFMALVSPKETQLHTKNLTFPKIHFSEYSQSEKIQGVGVTTNFFFFNDLFLYLHPK